MDLVRIDARAGARLRGGHPWVYSNEVRGVEGAPVAGDVVRVAQGQPHRSRDLGTAFYHPRSLIALRHLSFEGEIPDRAFLARRLGEARRLRERLFPGSDAWRLCHGEADGLPGLIVDRFASVHVVQAHSAGADRLLADVTAILAEEHGATSVVERDESASREHEGLPQRTAVLCGPPPGRVAISLPPLRLLVEPLTGQKTGAFLDQRTNREAVAPLCRGLSVYDAYCNAGAFSVHAALAGATSVIGVDASVEALALARANADLAGVGGTCRFEEAEARADMDERHRRRERFGVVLVDPPSLTRSRRHVPQARRALREINRRALTLVDPGGFLVTSCCSHHLRLDTFVAVVSEAAQAAGRGVALLDVRGASADHPVLPSAPEGAYLKCLVLSVR